MDAAFVTWLGESWPEYERTGARVVRGCFHDGASAIARIRAARPDAIVLDLMMPGMSGQEFLRLYRQLPGPHAPVIVISAAGYGARQHAAVSGAEAVLAKPFGTDRLLDLVAHCLARREAAPRREARAA